MSSITPYGLALSATEKTYAPGPSFRENDIDATIPLINKTNVSLLGFGSLEDLVEYLGPDNCSAITNLCIPYSFLFEKEYLNEVDRTFYLSTRPTIPGDKWVTADPFVFKMSKDKIKTLSGFPKLEKVLFQKSQGDDHCSAIHLRNLTCEIDLISLQSFEYLNEIYIGSGKKKDLTLLKEIDLTQLKHSNIKILHIFDRSNQEKNLVTGYENLLECESVCTIIFHRFNKEYDFLLKMPNLNFYAIDGTNCKAIDPELQKNLKESGKHIQKIST